MPFIAHPLKLFHLQAFRLQLHYVAVSVELFFFLSFYFFGLRRSKKIL